MTTKSLVKSKMGLQKATSIVAYLTPEEVYQMADAALGNRNGERDKLLILLLFETGLRVSEALSLTPRLLGQHNGRPVIHLKKGKGSKPRMVACPEDLAHRIRSYAYSEEIGIDDRIFPINRKRAWQIVKLAGEKANLQERVGRHLLRHGDAIEVWEEQFFVKPRPFGVNVAYSCLQSWQDHSREVILLLTLLLIGSYNDVLTITSLEVLLKL